MVVKGSARGAPGELAHHLLREDTNESVRVLELSGVASLDLAGALAEIDAMGAGSKSTRRMYHASINTAVDETLTQEQQKRARERLAEGLGLAGQPFVMVEHVKAGRPHWHVVWGRINQETGTAISDSHNYRRHEEASRALEVEFDHQRVQGAHVRDKQNEPRPERGPSWGEQRQAERSGLTPAEAKGIITAVWQRTETGREFQQALEAEGFTLARGDKRDFVLVDAAGEIHGLTRRIEGAKAKDVRERMADIEAGQLPDVEEARQQLRIRQVALEQEAGQEFIGTAERMNQAEAEENERAAWSPFEREAGGAVAQLRRTMGNELASVILADDRRTADRTPGQVLRESESIEDRQERDLAQRMADNLARTEAAEKAARDLAQEKEATGRGERTLASDRGQAAAIATPLRRSETAAIQTTPAGVDQAQPKRTFWQRLFGRNDPAGELHQEAKQPDSGVVTVAEPLPEATLRPSQEVEKPAAASKPHEEERHRPSFHLFARIFGAIIDAYQNALDRHNIERARIEQQKRNEWRNHMNSPKTAAQPPAATQAPERSIEEPDAEKQKRIEAARELRRLREQEEREDREHENYRRL